MQQFVDHSPTTAQVLAGRSWAQLVTSISAGDELVQGRPGNQVTEALVKPVGVVAGISNLTFHRDCHFGRHAYGCSGVDIGITVTSSGPENGSLRVVAGSHRIAVPVEIANTDPYLPVVAVATDPGDCTVHLSCTLHESTAPIIGTRKVMYTPYRLPAFADDTPTPPERGGPLREEVHVRFLDAGNGA
jgi:ectoine hydroxylase-related dioxygenase (phytanoyl-CoA dioxygenase family)